MSREQLLERQVAELEQANLNLQQELVVRAGPTVAEFIDGVDNLIRGARGGNLAAKQALAKLGRVMQEAHDAASPLEIVRSAGG